MLLADCELVPAVVTNTKDKLKLGRIKCVIPGYVDSTFSDYNKPWVRPLFMNKHQQFSKMMPGYKVWVLVNKSNYNEYWYIPLFEMNDVTKKYLDDVYDDDQPEVIISHNNGGSHPLFTYDEKNGFSERIGNDHIDLHPDSHISLLSKETEVDINGIVKIGQVNGDYQKAVMGDNLKKLLQQISSICTTAAGACSGVESGARLGFQQIAQVINEALGTLCCNNVKVN